MKPVLSAYADPAKNKLGLAVREWAGTIGPAPLGLLRHTDAGQVQNQQCEHNFSRCNNRRH